MLVLRGTVVTMRPGGAVPAQGEVYAGDDGLIAAVTPGDPVPPGFQGAPRVAAGGLIYPGLIDLQFMDNRRRCVNWRSDANTSRRVCQEVQEEGHRGADRRRDGAAGGRLPRPVRP
jgi:hypothetical protein